ncbi:MAG: nucleotide sugar dehydrogenase [Desulfovibrio sp.]|jgi:UDPglucose 6-dehydrogenase|nr:nucleotide sugar dehydrogenase [Desulfovibrio sp.]
MRISFIGLGKLGLCSAACFAAKGHTVVGVDADPAVLSALRAGRCPVREKGLEDMLERARENFSCTGDCGDAVRRSDLTMIIVPTPSRVDGAFSNTYVETALRRLAPALAARSGFHIVSVVSTVMPGSCSSRFVPLLEELTGKECGRDFGLVYNPEFIALGSVIRDFLHPDLVLIGASDERSARTMSDLYASIVESEPYYAVMSLINAEIAKLALNCFVTMKISFADELAALCERIPGADVDTVADAVGADSRVGRKYLKGGMGFGGPCFPRDNRAFQAAGRAYGYEALLGPRVIAVNDAVPERIFARIRQSVPTGGIVALFGVAYKRGTHIVEESQAIILAKRLVEDGYSVRLHDPLALDAARAELGDAVAYCVSPHDAAEGAVCIALLADSPEFAAYDWRRLESSAAPGALLLDAWRLLRGRRFGTMRYAPLGIGGSPGI